MKASIQIMKPKNWSDFEKLCKMLWGEIWNCADSIKLHGRQGQTQQGVDVYAYVDKYEGYCGIQCKGKDDYVHAQLTKAEIDNEIDKAKDFKPILKRLIFATTANKDAKIESYIREKDIECYSQGLFHVDVFSWEDIVDLLEQYRTVFNWYVNNCQFKEATDVSVSFNNGLDEITIYPEYIRTTKKYLLREILPPRTVWEELLQEINKNSQLKVSTIDDVFNPQQKVDKRWCKLNIRIENIGNTVMRSPKLQIYFREEDIEKLSDHFYYLNTPFINQTAVATINAQREVEREVFKEFANMVIYKPKEQVFLQTDERSFSFSIIPKQNVTCIPLAWKFLCEDYQKIGVLTICIEPIIEDKQETIFVESKEDVLPEEVSITPKIVVN